MVRWHIKRLYLKIPSHKIHSPQNPVLKIPLISKSRHSRCRQSQNPVNLKIPSKKSRQSQNPVAQYPVDLKIPSQKNPVDLKIASLRRDFEIDGILSDGILRLTGYWATGFWDWRDFEYGILSTGFWGEWILCDGILRKSQPVFTPSYHFFVILSIFV